MRWLCLLLVLFGGCVVAKTKTSTIIWPVGGLNKAAGYQAQPPFTCPQASNVRTVETLEGRRRGGRRPGIVRAYQEMEPWGVSRVLVQISTTDGRRLCSWAAGGWWLENSSGAMERKVPTAVELSSVANLHAAEYQGQLFIADQGGIAKYSVNPTTGLVSVTVVNDVVTVDAGQILNDNFGGVGVKAGHTVVLTERNGSGISGTYTVLTDPINDDLTLTVSTTKTGDAYAYIERGPKVFTPTDTVMSTILVPLAVGTWTEDELGAGHPMIGEAKGSAPVGYRLVCRYSNRLFWAGNDDAPYAWICSRAGDPLDYDFSWDLDDVGRATYWQASDQKTIGEPIKALIPSGNDYLIFGCTNSLWIMVGDPTYGGSLKLLDNTVGVLSATSWCDIPGGVMVLGHNGLHVIKGGAVVPISKTVLPRELIGINPTLYTISMCYDPVDRGVHVVATKTDTATHEAAIAYWIDLDNGAFWPESFNYTDGTDITPTLAMLQLMDDGDARVLLARKDGTVGYFSDDAATDDTGTMVVSGTLSPSIAGNFALYLTKNSHLSYSNTGNFYRMWYSTALGRWVITDASTYNSGTLGADYWYQGGDSAQASPVGTYAAHGAYTGTPVVTNLNSTVTGTVTLGPFRLGADDFHEGMLTKLVGILDEQSADVTYTIHVADTAEGAIAASAQSTGTWSAGRSLPDYVRARGASLCIKLSGTGLWAMESIVVEIERLGLVRGL